MSTDTEHARALLAQMEEKSQRLEAAGLPLAQQHAQITLWRRRSPSNWGCVRTPLGTGRCVGELESGPRGVRVLLDLPMAGALERLRAMLEGRT